MKTYYTRQSEFVFAESKLRTSEMEKKKAEESPNKRGNEKKIRNIDKIKEKVKHIDFQNLRIKVVQVAPIT